MLEKEFEGSRIIKIIPEKQISISKVTILEMVDNPVKKTVIARTSQGMITLWSDSEYDKIGNWTNEQVLERIDALFPSIDEKLKS